MKSTGTVATILTFLLVAPCDAMAGVDLPWSTTYDCADWNQYSDPLDCDGLNKLGSWTASPGDYYEQITIEANRAAGAGGKGQRHWIGDERNSNSGSLALRFNSPEPEFWARWYVRFESGMKLVGSKMLYFQGATTANIGYLNLPYGPDGMRYHEQSGGHQDHQCTGCGWQTIFGSDTSDGRWIMFEVHMKHETTSGGYDGVFQLWRDGELVIDVDSAQFGDPALAFGGFNIGSNSDPDFSGVSMYQDFDDIAVCSSGSPPCRPAVVSPPQNLRIMSE